MTLDSESEVADVWSRGAYEQSAPHYLPMAGRLVEATDVDADDEVLDVGCGTGNVAITAARRGATVTGVDVTPSMLDRARDNADRAGVDVAAWDRGTATDLQYETDAFDVTLSALGHVYGDPPADAAAELTRVTRPGGRIAFTSWTPTSLYPIMAGLLVTHLAPADQPEFTEPPFLWGDPDVVEDRLGPHVEDLTFETLTVTYPALSSDAFWETLATTSGPFVTLLDDVFDRAELRTEMIETIEPRFDTARNEVELEYRLATASVAPE